MDNEKVLHIRNMVCNRCIMVVENALYGLEIPVETTLLGKAVLKNVISKEKKEAAALTLKGLGFELIDDKKQRVSEHVKNSIVHLIHHDRELLPVNFSEYISNKLDMDYQQISRIFSETENSTIEKYIIAQKIERVKELLTYEELSLSEIAHQLHYSSVAHLSSQFKKVTGITPSLYKQQTIPRKPLDEV